MIKKTIPTISLSALKQLVEKELKIKDIADKCRSRELAQARFIYYKLSKKFQPLSSLASIGKHVKRDHATVINGLNKWDSEIIYDPYMEKVYDRISLTLVESATLIDQDESALSLQALESRISDLEASLINYKLQTA